MAAHQPSSLTQAETVQRGGPVVDLTALERVLRILADPSRLQLLSQLRHPRTVEEIRVVPHRALAGQTAERPMTRQAVRSHLFRLSAASLVRVRLAKRDSRRSLQEFVIDQARLFGVIEDLRQIGSLESTAPVEALETLLLREQETTEGMVGPRILHVNGPYEGRSLPLDSTRLRGDRGWVLGRGPTCQLHLEYDPYVSKEHAEVLRDAQGYSILDLRSGRNPTRVNWCPLAKGGSRRLRAGDIIGVGRSSLLFLDA